MYYSGNFGGCANVYIYLIFVYSGKFANLPKLQIDKVLPTQKDEKSLQNAFCDSVKFNADDKDDCEKLLG